MYSKETIKKLMNKISDLDKMYSEMPIEDIKMSLSTSNEKIGKVLSVSLPPIVSCGNCKSCINICYIIKRCLQFPNVLDAYVRNWQVLKRDPARFWDTIRKELAKGKYDYFRYHVSGEIQDYIYLSEMVKTAEMYPNIRFWTYTKMYSVVNAYLALSDLPENHVFRHA